MKNKAVEQMLLLGFGISLTLIFLVSGVAIHSSSTSKDAATWVGHTHEVMFSLQQIASDLYRAESAQRAYFVTAKESPYLAERAAALQSLTESLDQTRELTRDNMSQQRQLAALREAVAARTQTMERNLTIYLGAPKKPSSEFIDNFALGNTQISLIKRTLFSMREEETRLLTERQNEMERQHRIESISFATLIPLVVILLGLLFYRIRDDMRKRAIAETEQQKLIAILNATPDLVAMTDVDLKLSYMNKAGRQIFGLDEKAAISHLKLSDLTSNDGHLEDRLNVADHQGVWRGETMLAAGEGVSVPVLQVLMAHRLSETVVSYSTIAHDISERHQHEAELKESATYEESHSHALSLFSSTFDRKEILEGVLKLLAQRHHFPMSAVYIHDDWRGHFVCEASRGLPLDVKQEFKMGEGLLGEAAISGEDIVLADFSDGGMRLETGIGNVQPAAILISPIVYQGRSIGMMILAASRPVDTRDRDFVSRMATQLGAALHNVKLYADTRLLAEHLRAGNEEIARKNIELQQASRTKSEFLANMSHELRTPLNSIIGFSDVMKGGIAGELNEKQLNYLGYIGQSGRHLLALINDILDLSKVEAGKMDMDLASINVETAVDSSLMILKEKASQRRVEMRIDIAAGVGDIFVDERRFKQILFNLLSNAIKFSKENTHIEISARRISRHKVGRLDTSRPHRALSIAPGKFEEFLELQIADQGIGINQDGLNRLFEPFTQVDSSLSRRFEGTGLGLVMVMRLVELHGGTLGVSSQEGEGTCFTIWLPFRSESHVKATRPEQTQEIPKVIAVKPGEQRRVLVVEDDDEAAELIRLQLQGEGLLVERARTAEEGLTLAKQQEFAFVTLDILLPGMDGWEFLARIKESPQTEKLPVVIISVVADRNRGLSLGASAILQKPVSPEMLMDALNHLGLSAIEGRKLNVLIVDDDPRSVEIIASFLDKAGCNAIRTYGGKDGITTALQLQPDLIVLDLMMPDMSGFEVVEILKNDNRTSRIPILIVTAKQILDADRALLNGHVMQIIEKSEFNHGRFISEVRRVLGDGSFTQ